VSVGVKTPAGTAGQVRPRRSVSDEEAHRPPAESEAPGMEINISILNLTRVCLQSAVPFIRMHCFLWYIITIKDKENSKYEGEK